MQEYKSIAHAKTSLRYHLIFSTKYRQKCLKGIEQQTVQAFRDVEAKSDFKIIEIGINKDHVHLLITFKPSLSISQVVNRLKQGTTIKLYEKCEPHLKKFYWKKKKTLWTRGYFCSTIGEVSESKIREYIKNQG